MEAAAAAANVGFKSDELVDKYFKVELVNNLVDLVDEDVIICLNIVVIIAIGYYLGMQVKIDLRNMIFLNVDDDDVVVIGIYNMYFNEKKKKEPL